jgi:DNA-binding transcriptional ArsR family regulator
LYILPLVQETPSRLTATEELEVDDPAVVAALYDPLRYRLFRVLETPRTVAEVAEEIGLPANRLYYHLRRLLACGLVRQVDVRARGRHTERVYGRTAARIRFTGELELGGETVLRGIADELERGLRLAAGTDEPGLLSYHAVELTRERASELEERLRTLIAEYESTPSTGDDATRFGLLGVLVRLPDGAGG